ncbi:MAG TPA: xanthine dehydrogenase family protein molybdopterin-binding subunit [Tepidisphaeraceae bacterium]|nr:xanthine dehydrogenase family protein molybdopterin-binding subunit [Tepidisphaeraceae bacterium]
MQYIGKEMPRVDGVAKVTGRATYAAEFNVPNLAYGHIVTSNVARGRIATLDVAAAEGAPGVLKVVTHLNSIKPMPKDRVRDGKEQHQGDDQKKPGDRPFRALVDDRILFNQQPIAVVVAETFEQARYAASLVKATYREEPHATDPLAVLSKAYDPRPEQTPPPRGDPAKALADAPVKIEATYTMPIQHHNPMELHGGIGHWQGDRLVIFNKSQNVHGDRDQVAEYFGIKPEQIDVVSLFVGGAFGSCLRPNYYTFLLGVVSKLVGRPVKIVYTRAQTFTGHGYRPHYWQHVALGATKDGKLTAITHRVVTNTSQEEEHTESFVKPARTMYASPTCGYQYQVVKTDLSTPQAMRAPGMFSQMTAIECAMDELAYALKIDPLELRLINYAEKDPDTGKPYSSKALRECYKLAADTFGWRKRTPEPRSMRDGRLLVGWGMATGTWGAMQQSARVRVTLNPDGSAEVGSATADIGPGTYTVMTMIAAEYLGLPAEKITFKLGDTRLPKAPAQGGSWTTASIGTAIFGAARDVAKQLLAVAKAEPNSPLAGAGDADVELAGGHLRSTKDPARAVPIAGLLRRAGKPVHVTYESKPSPEREKYATAAHGAQFIEVKVDPDTMMVKVTRVIEATACGRIMNPLTSHSQEIGGVVWGIGAALHEATEIDHRYGRIMNASLQHYHVPTNADVHEIRTMFVEEDDKIVNPLGVKGMGELGMVGIAAGIANAVFHATGKRVRDFPITPDKLFA